MALVPTLMDSIFATIFSVAARLIVSVLFWVALLPVALVVVTPFILLLACWDDVSYFAAMRGRYAGFCSRWFNAMPRSYVDWS